MAPPVAYAMARQAVPGELNLDTMEEAYFLPETFHADLAHRAITATSRLKNYTLITADKNIHSYPHVNAIWNYQRYLLSA